MTYVCTECGNEYHADKACHCPSCNALPLFQLAISQRRSFSHVPASKDDYRRRPQRSKLRPDFTIHSTEEYTFIEDYEQSPVIIDYFCFTVNMKDFRHCRKESPYSGFHFPEEPVFSSHYAKDFSDIEAYDEYFKNVYTDYLQETARRFITRVLGFNYGAPRGRGFQFYDDSFVLTSSDGDDFCGQVGFGGNRDTMHFQINGHGCKHLFADRSCHFLHHWISEVLAVKQLARIDIAYDDFDGIHTCDDAEKAALKGAFKRSRGFAPKIGINDQYEYVYNGSDVEKTFTREERTIGSRQSNVYWRIYNKKLERNILKHDFEWYRSEVELKKWDVDILLNPAGAFVALNDYAASLLPVDIAPVATKKVTKKRAVCDVLSSVHWAKRQYGRLVNSLMELYDNDAEKVVSSLIRDDNTLVFSSMNKKLINALE
ncbi:MAG: replication initiation factor domain-containing protein [Vibrio sp.]